MQLQPYTGIQTGNIVPNNLLNQINQTGVQPNRLGYQQSYPVYQNQMWNAFSQMLSMMQSMMTGMMKIFQGILGQSQGMLGTGSFPQPNVELPQVSQQESRSESSYDWLKDLGKGLFEVGKDILGGGFDSAIGLGSKIFKGIKSLF